MRRQGNFLAAVLCFTAALSWSGFCVPAAADTITAMEYYIDTDPGVSNAIPVPPLDGSYDSTNETGQVSLITTNLAPGPHMVYVRARQSNGKWGTYPPQLLNVDESAIVVARVECYIDTDPGPGYGTALAPVDGAFNSVSETVTGSVSTAGLSVGGHTLYLRARSSAGIWGPARAMPLEVLPPVTVVAAQCGFGGPTDTNPTLGTFTMQAEDGAFGTGVVHVISNVPAPSAVGTYRVFVRAENNWILWTDPWSYTTLQVEPGEQNSGVRTNQFGTNQFGFTILGSSGLVIVVETCTNVANPTWYPLQTNTLSAASLYFSDPQWTNYPARFYRLRSP
jgi:hypothetical protein